MVNFVFIEWLYFEKKARLGTSFCSIVSVAIVTETGDNESVFIQASIDGPSDHLYLGILFGECFQTLWGANQVEEHYVLWPNVRFH